MSKRKYTKIKDIEPEILAMREEGKSLRVIVSVLGLDEKQMLSDKSETCMLMWPADLRPSIHRRLGT